MTPRGLLARLLLISSALVNALVLRQSFGMSPQLPDDRQSTVAAPRQKTVFAIRHGLSTANVYMRKAGNQWGDTNFIDRTDIDAPLCDIGVQQARELWKKKELFESVDLVLVSPLRRCLQTYLEGVHPVCGAKAVVLPLLRERVYTQSDTSHFTVEELTLTYPSLDWTEARKHNHPWHYTPASHEDYEEWRPNDAKQWYAVPGEPEDVFGERMKELEGWLRQRPETRILVVSHWGVIRHFTSKEAGNCQVVQFEIEAESDELTD